MRHGAGEHRHSGDECSSEDRGSTELSFERDAGVNICNPGDNPRRPTPPLKPNGELIDVLSAELRSGVDRVDPSSPLIVSHAGIQSWDVHARDDSESLPEKQNGSESRVTPKVAARYHQEMEENERLREKFKALVDQFGGRKTGIAEICKRFSEAGDSISPKYLDQIYAGFQGKSDNSPRTPGRLLIKRLEKNLRLPPRWFYVDDRYVQTPFDPLQASESTTRPDTAPEVVKALRDSVLAMLEVWGVAPKDLFSSTPEVQRRVNEKIAQKLRSQNDASVAKTDQNIRATEIDLSEHQPKKQQNSLKR